MPKKPNNIKKVIKNPKEQENIELDIKQKQDQDPEQDPEGEQIEQIDGNVDDENIEDNNDDLINDNENEIDDEDKKIEDDGVEDDAEKTDKKQEDDDDKCVYDYAGLDSDEEENDVELIFDDDNVEEVSDIVPADKRITKPILFKYERVRLLGDRTQQITIGAKPLIKNSDHLTPKQIAELELQNNVIPLKLLRPLPSGKKEKWTISELAH